MSDLEAQYRAMFADDLFRPRDEFDAALPPGTLRGAALDLREAVQRLADHITAWLPAMRSAMALGRQRPRPARRPHRRKHAPTRLRAKG